MVALGARVEVGQAVRVGPVSAGSRGMVAVELGIRVGNEVGLIWMRVALGLNSSTAWVAAPVGRGVLVARWLSQAQPAPRPNTSTASKARVAQLTVVNRQGKLALAG